MIKQFDDLLVKVCPVQEAGHTYWLAVLRVTKCMSTIACRSALEMHPRLHTHMIQYMLIVVQHTLPTIEYMLPPYSAACPA